MDIKATITPRDGDDTVWTQKPGGRWNLIGTTQHGSDDSVLVTGYAVAVDRERCLVRTVSGSIYHVPGPWPDDLDLPAMGAVGGAA